MPQDREPARDAARATAHVGIERLIDTLLPSLIAKLGTLNVGELEVREGDWHVRLRRPANPDEDQLRRATDRPSSRAHGAHDNVGAPAPSRGSATTGTVLSGASTNGTSPVLAPVGPGRTGGGQPGHDDGAASPGHGPIVTSPAVGIFQPGPSAVAGTRVRAGDRLGAVDMLGIPQDVLAPADGIVIGVLVEGGTAVEYGQELVGIELAAVPGAH